MGLARTGSVMSPTSGDAALAFSVNRAALAGGQLLNNQDLYSLFLAVVEATEEGVFDVLFAAETVVNNSGHKLEKFPIKRALDLLNKNKLWPISY